jgi:quinol monooxygenase YgiN
MEPGLVDCRVCTGIDAEAPVQDDTLVHYEERWESEAAVERRVRSDAFTKVLEVLEAGAGPPEVEFDFVTRQEGLDYVETVRHAGH